MWWPLIKDGIQHPSILPHSAYKYVSQTLISTTAHRAPRPAVFSIMFTAHRPTSKYAVNQKLSDILPHCSRTRGLYLRQEITAAVLPTRSIKMRCCVALRSPIILGLIRSKISNLMKASSRLRDYALKILQAYQDSAIRGGSR